MSDLRDLAQQLIDERYHGYKQLGWPCVEHAHCMWTDDAIKVIEGYQDLLRRVVDMLEACHGEGLWIQRIDRMVAEVKASLPEVNYD